MITRSGEISPLELRRGEVVRYLDEIQNLSALRGLPKLDLE